MVADVQDTVSKPHHLAEAGKPYRFTSETGSAIAKRRWEAANAQPQSEQTTQSANRITETPSQDQIARTRELKRLKKQLDNFDTLIEAETDAKALQMLTNARWKQFETWRILAGMPTPGSFKPMQPKQSRNKLSDLPDPE